MSIRTYAELVPPPEPEREVVLHMSRRQANCILTLLWHSASHYSSLNEELVAVTNALATVANHNAITRSHDTTVYLTEKEK